MGVVLYYVKIKEFLVCFILYGIQKDILLDGKNYMFYFLRLNCDICLLDFVIVYFNKL